MKPFWPIFYQKGWLKPPTRRHKTCVPNPAGEEVKFDFAGPIWGSLRFWLVGVWSLELVDDAMMLSRFPGWIAVFNEALQDKKYIDRLVSPK